MGYTEKYDRQNGEIEVRISVLKFHCFANKKVYEQVIKLPHINLPQIYLVILDVGDIII